MVLRSVSGSVPGGFPGRRESELVTSSVDQPTNTRDPATTAPAASPAPGDLLSNRYVVHEFIADGSTSRLCRALDRQRAAANDADPWVVLKIVSAPPGSAPDAAPGLQALRREAALARDLDHPNLPRIAGLAQDGRHSFVCMNWVRGESLAAILDGRGTRPMTRVQALKILDGVGRALAHLHGLGITHADVKPCNILVTAEGHATLLDFGVALGPGADSLPPVRGYTAEYASPDVLAGSEPVPADDLFSLGCVAYRMLAGHRAFGGLASRDAAARRLRPARPEALSPGQWRALERALAFARRDRQPDVSTFLLQFKAGRDEPPAVTEAPLAPPAPPVAAELAGGRLPRALGALLVIAVVAALGVWMLRDEPPATVAGAARPATSAPPPRPAAAPIRRPPAETPALAATPEPPPALPPRTEPAAPAAPAARTPPPARPGRARPEPPRPAGPAPAELAGPPRPAAVTPAGPVAGPSAPEGPPPVAATPPAASAADSPVPTVPFASLAVRRYVEPDYPRAAAARRLPGWVDVTFTVEPSGRTADVAVAGADPPGVFDEAALAAVRRWRFARDAAGSGEAVVRSRIRVRFDPAAAAR